MAQSTLDQSAGAIEYTDCFSAEGKDPPLRRVFWYDSKQSDGEAPESGVTLHCQPFHVHSDPEWFVAPNRVLSIGQIELFDF